MNPTVSFTLTRSGRRGHDETARVWDLETGECLRILEGHTGWVIAAALHADGRRAVTGSEDRTVRVWDLETGECLRTLEVIVGACGHWLSTRMGGEQCRGATTILCGYGTWIRANVSEPSMFAPILPVWWHSTR